MVTFGYGGGIRLGGRVELLELEGALEFEEEGTVGGVQEGGKRVCWESGCGASGWVEGDGWHWAIYWR